MSPKIWKQIAQFSGGRFSIHRQVCLVRAPRADWYLFQTALLQHFYAPVLPLSIRGTFFFFFFQKQRCGGRSQTSGLCVSHGWANVWTRGARRYWLTQLEDIKTVLALHGTRHREEALGAFAGLDAELLNAQQVACGSSGWAATWSPGSGCCCWLCSQWLVCSSATLR